MMFIYAVLGINLFATIKLQTYTNEYANFKDLWSSLNVLIRCAFGQDWPYFMNELANHDLLGCTVSLRLYYLIIMTRKINHIKIYKPKEC